MAVSPAIEYCVAVLLACDVEVPMEASIQPDIVPFSVGDSFKTFEELEKKVKEYEQFKSIQL